MSALQRNLSLSQLKQQLDKGIALQNITTAECARRQHTTWVWDASSLPSRSHYFPVYLEIFEALQNDMTISPDRDILVETTTGNAGAAAAYVAGVLGYSIIIFMPEDMPAVRIADVRQYLVSPESQLRLTPAGGYVQGMVSELRRFLSQHREGLFGKRLFALNHSRRAESVTAIYRIGCELLSRLPDGETLDYAVLALGNGTTTTGLGRAIREKFPSAKIVGVEPIEAPWFYIQKWPQRFQEVYGYEPSFHPHRLIGTGAWGVRFPNVDLSLIDDIVLLKETEWNKKLGELNTAGRAVGHSSAACQAVIEQLSLLNEQKPMTFFSMIYDPLSKY